jgi:translation initiation factor RLI1
MPSKVALVLYDKCHPELCPGGVCQAASACRKRVLRQEKPGQVPVPSPSVCASCSDCVRACPSGAIKITVM